MGVNEDERFDAMFRGSYLKVLGYCMRRAPAPAAQDATAEVFSIAWRRRRSTPDEPTGWLIGIARRVLANQARSERRRMLLLGRFGDAARAAAREPDAGSPVDAALEALPQTDGEIVRLAYWDRLSHGEIGEALGISANAVAVRLHRARRRLRDELTSPTDVEEDETCPTRK